MKAPLALGLVLLALAPAAQAAAPETLGKFDFWTAYSAQEDGQQTCYMSITARPPQPKGQKWRRGEVVLMITHRPSENSADVVSYTAGLKLKPSSEVKFRMKDKEVNLFTQDDTAWSRDAATDRALAAALYGQESVTISGYGANGARFNDVLNLKGGLAAYRAIGKACGLPVPEEPKVKPKPKTQKKLPLKGTKKP